MRVIDIEDVVYAMRNQTQFVLRCEEVFHDKISSAAAAILSAQPRKPFVCLTGPSGSGKTTTAMRLQAYLKNLGLTKSPSPRKTDGRKYTLLEFAQEFTKSKGTYVIKISNHLTCVQNGYICDTWDCSNYCVGNYWKIK